MKSTQAVFIIVLITFALFGVYSEECGPNEYYNECGPSKEKYCFAPKKEIIGNCVAGCFCGQGYIRKLEGEECISLDYCPPFLPME
uniref:TIL domain-containing protein n=1 Tax=Anopheles funestus TaxID=62324 RepID=A0A4Y0BU63_ANOFN